MINGRAWNDSTSKAIVAEGQPSDSGPVALLRLQRLLEDRFQLRLHTEIRKVEEQLGLRLRPGFAPGEALVIDSVERPGPD